MRNGQRQKTSSYGSGLTTEPVTPLFGACLPPGTCLLLCAPFPGVRETPTPCKLQESRQRPWHAFTTLWRQGG